MKLLFLLLALLVTLYLFCLSGKLWLLSKRKSQLQRTIFNRRQSPIALGRLARKKRQERFFTLHDDDNSRRGRDSLP